METLRHQNRVALAVRRVKVSALQARRLADWVRHPERWRRNRVGNPTQFPHTIYRRAIPINRCDDRADPRFESGKRTNIAVAAPHFDGLVLSPRAPLSFWRALGRPARSRGFAIGMEMRAGCLIPTVGGGICLLSNALFRAACELGWTILERHGHTLQATPDTPGELWGLDATVLWPQVDLRIAPRRHEALLCVTARSGELIVEIRSRQPRRNSVLLRETRRRRHGRLRRNRIERVVIDQHSHQVIARDVVAVNRKRVLDAVGQRRNCMTCDESRCAARSGLLRNLE